MIDSSRKIPRVKNQSVENLLHHVLLNELTHENGMRCDYHFITSFGIDLTLCTEYRESSHAFVMMRSDVTAGTMRDDAH